MKMMNDGTAIYGDGTDERPVVIIFICAALLNGSSVVPMPNSAVLIRYSPGNACLHFFLELKNLPGIVLEQKRFSIVQ
jgi:hypothetical protein